MDTTIRTSTGILVILLATVVMVALARSSFPRPTSPQLHNLAVAERLTPEIQALLATDPGFKGVKVGPYTGREERLR